MRPLACPLALLTLLVLGLCRSWWCPLMPVSASMLCRAGPLCRFAFTVRQSGTCGPRTCTMCTQVRWSRRTSCAGVRHLQQGSLQDGMLSVLHWCSEVQP